MAVHIPTDFLPQIFSPGTFSSSPATPARLHHVHQVLVFPPRRHQVPWLKDPMASSPLGIQISKLKMGIPFLATKPFRHTFWRASWIQRSLEFGNVEAYLHQDVSSIWARDASLPSSLTWTVNPKIASYSKWSIWAESKHLVCLAAYFDSVHRQVFVIGSVCVHLCWLLSHEYFYFWSWGHKWYVAPDPAT